MPVIRFGRDIDDLPQELEFGDWGTLETAAALDLFQDVLDYFDQEAVQQAEDERRAMIRSARRYYDGLHAKPLKVNPGEPDDNVLVNLCRSLLDDSVSWLFGNPETGVLKMKIRTADDEPEAESADEANGALLEQVYEASGGFNFFKRLGMRGGVAGHFFVKIVPQGEGLPKLTVMDPLLTTVRTDPADVDKVTAYKVEWKREETEPNSRRKETYIYRQLIVEASEDGSWIVGDFKTKDRKRRQWQMIEAWAWPYMWPPIVDGPNIEAGWGYYGLSDLEDVAGINDGINFLSSNTMRILKFHAHPKTIGTGMEASDLQETAIDSFWTVPNEAAKITNLEMQSDLASSMAFLDFLKTAFWGIGRGLDPASFKDKIGQITNFALRVLAIRALHKAGDKRLTYGKALRTLNSHILEMTGRPAGETVISWPEPLPEDPAQQMDILEREVTLEVASRQTASEELGRSWKIEQERIRKEREERASLGEYLIEQFDRGAGAGSNPFGAKSNNGENRNDR